MAEGLSPGPPAEWFFLLGAKQIRLQQQNCRKTEQREVPESCTESQQVGTEGCGIKCRDHWPQGLSRRFESGTSVCELETSTAFLYHPDFNIAVGTERAASDYEPSAVCPMADPAPRAIEGPDSCRS